MTAPARRTSPTSWQDTRFRAVAATLLALFLVLAFATALTKSPWCDEGWFASPGRNLAFKGFMGTTVLDPASGTPVLHTRTRLDGIDRYTYWVLPVSLVTQAGWYKLVGFSLLSMRALSILFALLALASWWIVFERLSGDAYTALLAVALLEVDYQFVWSAADGRMDMICSALGAAGLAAYLMLRDRGLGWALFAANALIAASGLCHPNGDLYFLALLCLVLMFDRKRFGFRHLVVAGVPYAIALGLWLPYLMKAPDLFKIQLLGNTVGRESAFSAPLHMLVREVQRYLYEYGFAPWSQGFAHVSIVNLLAYAGGFAACAAWAPLRRQEAARRVVILTSAIGLFLYLFEGAKITQYLLHVIPWVSFALAISVMYAWTRGWRVACTVAVGGLLFLSGVRLAVPALKDNYHRRYLPAAQFVKSHASPRDLVMGPADLAFDIGFDRQLLDDIMLGTTTGKVPLWIVMDARYQDYEMSISKTAPAEYERVAARLAEYDKVYDRDTYQIYRRR